MLVGNTSGYSMRDEPPRKSWGAGRVIFMARLDRIRSEIGEGYPLTAIFDRHRAVLGIGYRSFCKLVNRYAGDARLIPRRSSDRTRTAVPAHPRKPASAVSAVELTPLLTPPKGPVDARHEPATRPTFKHSGVVQEGEPEQLLGPGFLKRRS
jgi:hypothetical protein